MTDSDFLSLRLQALDSQLWPARIPIGYGFFLAAYFVDLCNQAGIHIRNNVVTQRT